MKMQCLWYALDKWYLEGGYILFRKSSHWCMPHVLHMTKDGLISHYVPPENLKYPWYSVLGFPGYIKYEDDIPADPVPPVCMFFGTLALMILGGVWLLRRLLRK